MSKAAIVLDMLILLTERQLKLQNLLQGAQAQGRDVSEEELAALRAEDDQSAADLDAAIARSRATDSGV